MRTVWGQALGFHEKDSSENVGYFLELAKNNQVPASFPRTVFSVPAHAEDAGGAGKHSWGSSTRAVCSDQCNLALTCSLMHQWACYLQAPVRFTLEGA